MASRCWTVFSLRVRRTRIADIASDTLSIIIIGPGLDSRARTALEHMLESVVSARGKVLRTNFSATQPSNASGERPS